MENQWNELDRHLKGKLSDWEPTSNQPDWNWMEKHLEEEDEREAAWMAMVRTRMQRMDPPYNPAHWQLMSRRLDRSRRFFLYRVPQAALLLLALWTTCTNYELRMGNDEFVEPSHAMARQAPSEILSVEPSHAMAPAEYAIAPNEILPVQPSHAMVLQAPNEILPVQPLHAMALLAPNETLPVQPSHAMALLAPNETLPVQPSHAMALPHGLAPAPIQPRISWYLFAGSGVAWNAAHSQQTSDYIGYPVVVDTLSYQFSIGAGVQWRRFHLTMAPRYAVSSFQPIIPAHQFGTFDYLVVEEFEEIHWSFLEIPVLLRYDLRSPGRRWNAFVQGGLGINALLRGRYDISREEFVSKRDSETGPSREEKEAVNALSMLNERPFPMGILQGGALSENAFLSLQAGIGLEYRLSREVRIYGQGGFQQSLTREGFGPNSDHLTRLSLDLGLRKYF